MLEYRGIDLTYSGKTLFRGFDFRMEKGSKVAVLGRSGTGKSTLLNLALGFAVPDGGEVLVGGTPVDEDSVWDIRRRTAYVDQDVSLGEGRAVDFIRSVFELKANAGAGFPGGELNELLEYFELQRDKLKDDIGELSGGERQRVAIILAALLGRDLFLLDEATSALDRGLKEKTAEFFARGDSWTVLVISHDPVWVEDPRVRVFDLENGEWIR